MMPIRRVALAFLIAWLGVAQSAQHARAQNATTDAKVAAEALFDEGLSLMQKGDIAAACIKLEQSQSIDRGIGTMLYLAECYEKSGRSASAWALFRQAASEAAAAGESERAEAGRRRAERLTPLLSKLTLNVTAPAPAGLELKRNGTVVPSALWGVATPVDPGEQRVDARAPGYEPWSAIVQVSNKPGDQAVLVVPALVPAPAGATPMVEAPTAPADATESETAAPAAATAPAQVDASARRRGDTQRTVGLVLGGAGIVAVGVGAVFGLQAISKEDDAQARCPNSGRCADEKGVALSADAHDAAGLANVFVIGGAALAAAGVVVYLIAPRREQPTIAVASDGRSVRATLGGVF